MRASWMRARTDLRRGWRSWLVLAVITGMFGGVVIAAAAGARRTDSAYPRFLEAHRAFDQLVFNNASFSGVKPIAPETIGSVPQVETWVQGTFFNDMDDRFDITGSTDPRLGTTLNAPTILEGRRPDPSRADEAYVPQGLAKAAGRRLGQELSFDLFGGTPRHPVPVPVRLTIVGIGLAPSEFPPEGDLGPGWVHLTPAFVDRYLRNDPPISIAQYVLVWLKHGTEDLPAFQAGVDRVAEGRPLIGFQQAALSKNVERSFRLQAVALWLLAGMLALAAIALAGQSIARATSLEARDHPPMSAMGMTGTQLFGIAMLRVALVGGVASAIACAVAVVLSPLSPSGLARVAEPDPGFAADWTALGIGAAATAAFALLLGLVPAWRAARATAGRADASRSSIAEAASRGGLPVTTTLGLRFALERGSGRRAVPTRATIVGMSLAIAAIAASFTFGGSLQHLLRTPRLYGATWHLVSETEGEVPLEDARRIVRRIERNPDVLAASVAYLGVPVRLGNVIADGFALDDPSPALLPPLLQGRYPAAPDEIALGANTMRRIGVRLGARVDARFTGLPERGFRIVGVAVVPTVGHTANLGEGSLLTPAGVGRLFQGAFDTGDTASEIVVAVRPGAARAPVESFLRVVTRGSFPSVHPPLEPGDLLNFGRQRNLPFVLAAILAALAAVTLAHALVTGITRRRRDLAILKATGMRPRQARAAVAWQATALATAGILVGLPAGTAAGRWLWSAYATRLGILSEPRAPVVLLALTIPAVLVVANAIAFEPGRRAARIRPASVLRAE